MISSNFTVIDTRVVIRGVKSRRKEAQLLCRCVCGNEKWYPKYNITSGRTKSCGCIGRVKHGEHDTRLYSIWCDIKRRCNVGTCHAYKYYGARGITYCNDWENYVNFRDWAVTHGYSDNFTIDRIDVNGNYEPGNCRWVDMKIQQNNKRNNKIILYKDEKHTISEWSEIFNEPKLNSRLKLGWSFEEAANIIPHVRICRTKVPKTYYSALEDKYYTICELAEKLKCSKNTIITHLRMSNYSVDNMLSKPENISWCMWEYKCCNLQ